MNYESKHTGEELDRAVDFLLDYTGAVEAGIEQIREAAPELIAHVQTLEDYVKKMTFSSSEKINKVIKEVYFEGELPDGFAADRVVLLRAAYNPSHLKYLNTITLGDNPFVTGRAEFDTREEAEAAFTTPIQVFEANNGAKLYVKLDPEEWNKLMPGRPETEACTFKDIAVRDNAPCITAYLAIAQAEENLRTLAHKVGYRYTDNANHKYLFFASAEDCNLYLQDPTAHAALLMWENVTPEYAVEIARTAIQAASQAVEAAGRAETTAREANETAGNAVRTAEDAARIADGAATVAGQAKDTAEGAARISAETKKEVEELPFGYYQPMRVGTADHLTPDGVATTETIKQRTAGGQQTIQTGSALIKAVKGNTAVYNQLVPKLSSRMQFSNGITMTVDANRKITLNGTATAQAEFRPWNISSISGHKYFIASIGLSGSGRSGIYLMWDFLAALDCYDKTIKTTVQTGEFPLVVRVPNGFTCDNVIIEPVIIDLTKMFTAGNEPASVAEFEAQCPKVADPYAYNAGTIVGMTAEGITTEDGEGNPVSQRKWSNILATYFGGVMHGFGGVRDEFTGTKAAKRFRCAKIKDIAWGWNNHTATKANISDIKYPAGSYESYKTNVITDKYQNVLYSSRADGTIYWYLGTDSLGAYGKVLAIRDDKYNSLEDFLAARGEDIFVYELATPEEHTYDELAMTYGVTAGGMEEMLAEGESMPIVADIVYPLNELGAIRTNTANIGNLANLATSAKGDIVSAINEIYGLLTNRQSE